MKDVRAIWLSHLPPPSLPVSSPEVTYLVEEQFLLSHEHGAQFFAHRIYSKNIHFRPAEWHVE